MNHQIKALRRMFKAAHKEGYLQEDPMQDLARAKAPPEQRAKIRRPFTYDELTRLAEVMDDKWRVVLLPNMQ